MAKKVTPTLMFDGTAEQAMLLYVSLFNNAEIGQIERYGANGMEMEGLVVRADFTIGGQQFFAIDSREKHNFSFTPSFSIFVECDSEEELHNAFVKLSAKGDILMPLNSYGFSTQFGWLNDRYGVSWQLNLA